MPNIYYFNPTCELEIVNSTNSYQPPRLLQQFQSDLESIQLFFAKNEDIVIVDNDISLSFAKNLKSFGFNTPTLSKLENINLSNNTNYKLLPWGWSQLINVKFRNLINNYSFPDINKQWNSSIKELYSRTSALKILKTITSGDNNYLQANHIPEICTNKEQVEVLLDKWSQIVIKSPYSSSGRGVQMIKNNKLSKYNLQWIKSSITSQKLIMVEPLLNRVVDFAFQFTIKDGEINYLGISYFKVNANGSYEGNYVGDYKKIIKPEFFDFINKHENKIVSNLYDALKQSNFYKYYEGNLGIDSFLFINDNKLQIHPCVEINCRQNMGQLSLEINKRIAKNSFGIFKIYFDKQKSYYNFNKIMEQQSPIEFSNGKIKKGYFSLTNPTPENIFGVYAEISD